jgi:3D (Asp-Asp-Asp) domain-containing protein
MRKLLIIFGFAFLLAASVSAREQAMLARVTVYWPGEGQLRACSNGAKLRAGHCAVDPKRIPFGSRVVFPDTTCTAVDSGPAVVSRKAARATGRTALQREAVVIDRFFESREAAMDWESSHPHFMTVRVVSPRSLDEPKSSPPEIAKNEAPVPTVSKTKSIVPQVNADGTELVHPDDSMIRPSRRKTS